MDTLCDSLSPWKSIPHKTTIFFCIEIKWIELNGLMMLNTIWWLSNMTIPCWCQLCLCYVCDRLFSFKLFPIKFHDRSIWWLSQNYVSNEINGCVCDTYQVLFFKINFKWKVWYVYFFTLKISDIFSFSNL